MRTLGRRYLHYHQRLYQMGSVEWLISNGLLKVPSKVGVGTNGCVVLWYVLDISSHGSRIPILNVDRHHEYECDKWALKSTQDGHRQTAYNLSLVEHGLNILRARPTVHGFRWGVAAQYLAPFRVVRSLAEHRLGDTVFMCGSARDIARVAQRTHRCPARSRRPPQRRGRASA